MSTINSDTVPIPKFVETRKVDDNRSNEVKEEESITDHESFSQKEDIPSVSLEDDHSIGSQLSSQSSSGSNDYTLPARKEDIKIELLKQIIIEKQKNMMLIKERKELLASIRLLEQNIEENLETETDSGNTTDISNLENTGSNKENKSQNETQN